MSIFKYVTFALLFACAHLFAVDNQSGDSDAKNDAKSQEVKTYNSNDIIFGAFYGLPYANIPDDDLSKRQCRELAEILKTRLEDYDKAIASIKSRIKTLTGETTSSSKSGTLRITKAGNIILSLDKNDKANAVAMPVKLPDGTYDDASKAVLTVDIHMSNAAARGTAFFAKMRGSLFIVTNLHVARDAEKLVMKTINGDEITVGDTMYIAKNQDAVLFPIDELPKGVLALDILEDVSGNVNINDDVIACGNSQGAGAFLRSPGKVMGIGPSIIETSCTIFGGNSGSPIYHSKTQQVVGVISHVYVGAGDLSDAISKKYSNSPIKKSVRYFGQRIDSTKNWEKIRVKDYIAQCKEIKIFQEKCGIVESFDQTKALKITSEYGYDDFYKIARPMTVVSVSSNAYKPEARNYYKSMFNLMKQEIALLKARKFSSAFDKDLKSLFNFLEFKRDFYEEKSKSFD